MRYFLCLLFCLALVSCAEQVPISTAAATPAVTVTSERVTVAAATPSILPPSLTAVLPTPTLYPSPTQEPTPTLLPIVPPTGRIYFLWDPKVISQSGPALGNPIQNLYFATFNENSTTWSIRSIAEGLVGWPGIVISPDKTQFVLTPLEDRNKDGYVSQEGNNRGFDAPNLYTFDLANEVLTPITTDYPEIRQQEVYWQPDGQTILLGQHYTITLLSLNNQSRQQLGPAFTSYIDWLCLPPDTQTVIAKLINGELVSLNLITGETLLTLEDMGDRWLSCASSADSQWVTLNRPPADSFFLIETGDFTVEPVSLGGSIGLIAWSPISSTMALHWFTDIDSRLMLFNPENLTIEPLTKLPTDITLDYLGWSPDGTQIVYWLRQEAVGSLYTIDLNGSEPKQIWQHDAVGRSRILGWSPDSNWLLIFVGQWGSPFGHEPAATVYIVHRSGHLVYELLETAGSYDPYGFFWLP